MNNDKTRKCGDPYNFKARFKYFREFLNQELSELTYEEILKFHKHFDMFMKIYEWKDAEHFLVELENEYKNKFNINSCKENVSSAYFLQVIEKLPHSKNRVSYKYHHDYLREKSKFHSNMTRREVALTHKSNNIELHAIALAQIINDVGIDMIFYLNSEDIVICKKAIRIADKAISRYNN